MYNLLLKKKAKVTLSNDGDVVIQDIIKSQTIKVEINGAEITGIPYMENIFSIYSFGDQMFVSYNYSETTLFFIKIDLKETASINWALSSLNVIELHDSLIFIGYNKLFQYYKIEHTLFMVDFPDNAYYSETITDDIILCLNFNDRYSLIAYKYVEHEIITLWHLDVFNNLFPDYNLKGDEDYPFRIGELKTYNGDFIVVTSAGLARLDAQTGKVMWKTEKRYCNWVEIVGQIGYISGGNKLSKINLETGVITGYGWRNNLLPQIEFGGEKYWARGGYFVYNDGLLWHSVNMSGKSFIVAIDPKDGSYRWVERVDSEHIYEPQFHDDKMYISDINGNLFIYQKETK